MTEEKIKETAKQMAEMTKRIAETSADEFEKWLKEHRDSTHEEAHKTLHSVIEAAIVSSHLMLGVLL